MNVASASTPADARTPSIGASARRSGVSVDIIEHDDWPLHLARVSAIATLSIGDAVYSGHGAGTSDDDAALRAIMECFERRAQFRLDAPLPDATGSWTELQDAALLPTDFGLYDASQYAMDDAFARPFSEMEALEWLYVTELVSGRRQLVPMEFIYPRATSARRPLVVETSSGTAAHMSEESAALGAVCEVIERDGLMLFWHREPETFVIPACEIPFGKLRDEISRMSGMGYVVVVASLCYDLGIPCVLVIGLRGQDVVYGVGCHPDAEQAMAHAVAEAGQGMLWSKVERETRPMRRTFADVRTPDDHYKQYHCGPRHEVLRQILNRTLRPMSPAQVAAFCAGVAFDDDAVSDRAALASVVDRLAARNLQTYCVDITPHDLRGDDVRIIRALVPGLIPLHFGFSRMRLGNPRLVGENAPGRFCSILPHFLR